MIRGTGSRKQIIKLVVPLRNFLFLLASMKNLLNFFDCVEECDAGDDLFGTMMSFNEPIYADEITIQIKNVRKGTENEKLCKTTIYFYRSK